MPNDLSKTAIARVLDPRIVESLKERFNGDKKKKDAFYSAILNMVKTNAKIAECDVNSILTAAANCAQLGLLPISGLDHAYFVPFNHKVQLIIGYKGYMELARRSGSIKAINVEIIYENDEFHYEGGLSPLLRHIPYWLRKPPLDETGEIYGAYVIAEFSDGTRQADVFSIAEIVKSKKASKASDKSYSPWQTWPEEMIKKTAIRKAAKRWPMSILMARATELDTSNDLGRVQEADLSGIIPSDHLPVEPIEVKATVVKSDEKQENMAASGEGESLI